ncbi:metal-sensing transcriptional repressor [Swaminathania salitolerans]|uniref:Metal resistance protein n=1 Tax=Swaminathania salitolerans TaxID=182838 RepID=A0A511BKX3_9PROT|nr:metal-sensing transcriptional repressor [Swaminathania salitolerans]GBQ09369.1 hypothetical protein AA21291_0043 [Swaminathania salitolerans LMG 21291]GEL01000.1 hypothetical protein SSA02_01630 [Swaminathania salitolerans]
MTQTRPGPTDTLDHEPRQRPTRRPGRGGSHGPSHGASHEPSHGSDHGASHKPSHRNVTIRLKQAHGHLATILEMIESDRSCADLAQQIQAVENTIRNAKRRLIRDHVEHCIVEALADGGLSKEHALEEFSHFARYL